MSQKHTFLGVFQELVQTCENTTLAGYLSPFNDSQLLDDDLSGGLSQERFYGREIWQWQF